VGSNEGNVYLKRGLLTVCEPEGVIMVTVGVFTMLGMAGDEAQSQKGMRKVWAAAWYLALSEPLYSEAMVLACVLSWS